MWGKSCSQVTTGEFGADNQLTIGGPGYQGLMALARSHLTVEKYDNNYTENILPFVRNLLTTKPLITCDAYLTACLHRTYMNMKLSTILWENGHKLKRFYHANGYCKSIAHKSNIYKTKPNPTTGEMLISAFTPVLIHSLHIWG